MYDAHPNDRGGTTGAGRRSRLRHLLLFAASLALALACDDGGGTGPEAPTITAVEVTPAVDSLTALGSTLRLTAVARTSDGGTDADAVFTWSSAAPTVVSVNDSTGEARAVSNGAATITATTAGVSGSATLYVAQAGAALVVTTQPAGAAAGQPLATQPVLEILDANGNRVTTDDATVVTASVTAGEASVEAGGSATAEGGIVTFTGLAVGGPAGSHTLRFTADGLPEATSGSFSIDAGPPAAVSLADGDGQTGLAATPLSDSLAVAVTDGYGNPGADVEVTWSSTGDGALARAASSSDPTGVARNAYTLGDHPGVDTVLATVEGLEGSPVRFVVTATPNATIAGTVGLEPAAALRVGGEVRRPPRRPSRAAAFPHPPDVVWAEDARPGSGGSVAAGGAARADGSPRYTPDELLVAFNPSSVGVPDAAGAGMSLTTARRVSQTIRGRLAEAAGATFAAAAGVSPVIATARVRVDPARLEEFAEQLRALPGVVGVSRNGVLHPDAADRPVPRPATAGGFPTNDPYYAFQAWHYGLIDLPAAWEITTGARSVVVAVLDDGVRFDHPAIAPNLTDDGYDFVDNRYTATFCSGWTGGHAMDGDGYDADPTVPGTWVWDAVAECYEWLELGGHGLHVAGTIGAVGNDGLGMAGVSWNVAIRPVRVVGAAGAPDYDVAQGVLYAAGLPADDGVGGTVQAPTRADIINMSLGGPTAGQVLRDAIAAAADAGSLIVVPAGNTASSDPHFPADLPQTLSVSAVGPDGELASYSNRGPKVDIVAPGGDLADGGSGFTVWSTIWDFSRDRPTYAFDHGTSMAAAHVSGVAALLLADDPSLTADQLRARLLDFAVDLGDPGRDDLYGAGLVNARNSLTRSRAPDADLYARLYDAATGAAMGQVPVDADGGYAFPETPDGDFYVFAGMDREGDAMIGLPGRRWGAYGSAADPAPVTIDGAGTYDGVDFVVGKPREIEPNQARQAASFLPLGGWLRGDLDPELDAVDYYRVTVPADGSYTFETSPVSGACGFALEEDTFLRLFNEAGATIEEKDDIDLVGYDWCSRITVPLTPGTYYLEVSGYNGGRYQVQARSGS